MPVRVGKRHLERVLDAYAEHYNARRALRALGLRVLNDSSNAVPFPATRAICRQVLGGLINEYAAAG